MIKIRIVATEMEESDLPVKRTIVDCQNLYRRYSELKERLTKKRSVKMKGLKIFFNGEEIDVSSDFGVSLMVCTKSEKEQSVANLVGIDREKNTYTWLNSLMNTGDVIDMEIAELNRSSVPISVEKFFSEEEKSNQEKSDEMWAKDLADYYALEKLLKEEGFL